MADAAQKSVEQAPPKRRRSKLRQGLLGVALLVCAIWAAWFFTSDAFRNVVRMWLEHRIETTTGGKASVGALHWNLSKMEFEATNVTLHGLEAGSEKPFAHVDRVFARVQVRSFFHRQVDFEYLAIDHPTIHLIVYPDGTTNQPVPEKKKESDRTPVEQLVDLAVGKLELNNAELILNQQTIPIALDANDVTFASSFDHAEKRYDGKLGIGKLEAHIDGWRPLPTTGELDFSLFRDHGLVRKLSVRTGKSSVEASGLINDFEHLAAQLTYRARVDVREMAATARIHDLREGTLDLQGTAKIAPQGSATNGNLKFAGLNFDDGEIRVRGMSGQSQYAMDGERMTFGGIAAKALGGNVSGDGEIRNWVSAKGRAGTINLRVVGVQLRDVAEATSSKKRPLRDLHFDGDTTGTVRLTWRGSFQDARADLALRVSPRVVTPSGELPVTADVLGAFFLRSQTMQIESAHLSTPQTTVSGQGSIGGTRLQLKVMAHSNRATEFRAILHALQEGNRYPVEFDGAVVFNGTLSGTFDALNAAGHLEVRDFTTVLPMEAAKGAQPGEARPVHWDSLVTELRYSPSQVTASHSMLVRGSTQAAFDANLALVKGQLTETSPLTVRGNLRHADIREMQSVLGYNYPVSGWLNANLQVTGTQNDLHGGGHVQLSNATFYGEPNCSINSDLQFNGGEVQFLNFKASNPAGEVSATGAYNLRTSAFRFNLQTGAILLTRLHLLQEKRIQVGGTGQLEAAGSGTSDAPSIDAKLHLRDFTFGGEMQGNIDLDAKTSGEVMTLKGVSDFANADLQMNGTVRLRDNFPAQLAVTFRNLDIDPVFAAYIQQFHTTSHTLLAGRVELNGPLRDPKQFAARGQIDSFAAGVENVKVANQGPILFSVQKQSVSLDWLHLVGEGTDFTASGQAGLTGNHSISARATGSINMRILQSFSPEYTSSGLTRIDLNASGTLQQPRIRGRIQITNGAISYVDLPNGLSNINGTMSFNEDRLQVQTLTAHTGGGDLNLGGFIRYSNGLSFNLVAHGKEIRLRYPPGVSASGDADLTLAGTPKNALLSGDITVTRFGLNPRFDFASYLAKSKMAQAPVSPDSPLNGVRLDVHVVSTPELQLETSLAKVTGSIDLRLRGTAARPVLLGRLNIFEGDIVFNSTTYHLERGEITFNNPAQIQPVLDIEASAHVRDYDITLGFHGPADRPSISYRSDPPLPTADIIALLALGRTRQESATAQMYNPQQQTLNESDENALLGQALNATVSSRVQRLFGVSRIKIDPQVGGAENNTNARLTIEQQVSNKITITYITNLSQSAQQIIQVEWNITRDLSLQGIRDQTGVLGFDVRIRQRKK